MASNIFKARFEVQGYINGRLEKRSRWVSFPITDSELMQSILKLTEDTEEQKFPSFCKRMVRVVEWDYPSFIREDLEGGECGWAFNLDKVNEIASQFADISEEDMEIVEALLDEEYELDDALRIVRNGDYEDFRNDDEEDIVKHFLEEDCGRRVPDYILDNVDWDDAFSDLKDDRCGTFIEVGYGYIYIS